MWDSYEWYKCMYSVCMCTYMLYTCMHTYRYIHRYIRNLLFQGYQISCANNYMCDSHEYHTYMHT
jgi:hypothetical protein